MTLTLILLRHAKAEPDSETGRDFDRTLAPRGRRDGGRLAAALRRNGVTIDAVMCSPAQRTRQTLAILRRSLGRLTVSFPTSLYLAPEYDLISVIRAQPPGTKTLLAIGHNPGLHELATVLVGDHGRSNDVKRLRNRFPTCTWCEIAFNASSWRLVRPGAGRLVRLLRPRDLSD